MADYTEKDLPVTLKYGEYLTLDGGSVRFEANGEAKDIFFGDSFERDVELFPSGEYIYECGGKKFKLYATFDGLEVSVI